MKREMSRRRAVSLPHMPSLSHFDMLPGVNAEDSRSQFRFLFLSGYAPQASRPQCPWVEVWTQLTARVRQQIKRYLVRVYRMSEHRSKETQCCGLSEPSAFYLRPERRSCTAPVVKQPFLALVGTRHSPGCALIGRAGLLDDMPSEQPRTRSARDVSRAHTVSREVHQCKLKDCARSFQPPFCLFLASWSPMCRRGKSH